MDLESTNPYLRYTVRMLIKASNQYNAPLWRSVAELLSRPRRKRIAVNVGRLNRLINDGDVVVVPGKVLGGGVFNKKATVAAWAFSKTALEKIRAGGGEALSILDLVKARPKPSGVKIIV